MDNKSPCNSQRFPFSETMTLLALRKEDIVEFVGEDGTLFREHVVNHACNALIKKSGFDDPDPHVTIKVVTLSNGLL